MRHNLRAIQLIIHVYRRIYLLTESHTHTHTHHRYFNTYKYTVLSCRLGQDEQFIETGRSDGDDAPLERAPGVHQVRELGHGPVSARAIQGRQRVGHQGSRPLGNTQTPYPRMFYTGRGEFRPSVEV